VRATILALSCIALLAACGTADGPPAEAASPTGMSETPHAPESEPPPPPPPGASTPSEPPPVVDHGPRTVNQVALTFDADLTPWMESQLDQGHVETYADLEVLRILEQAQVGATFFLTGMWVERYPEVTSRIADNPRFDLANHSYSHLGFTDDCYNLGRVPPEEMLDDVARTFEIIEAYGGRLTRYFRFPGLCHDEAALEALAPLGLTVVDGDVVSGDAFATAWEPVARGTLDAVQPGSIIIMHVTAETAPFTAAALPHILAGLAERGLEPVALSDLLAGAAH
jgi:peptidoglycan/xylan/chitin deacetylase (PgdA/CDA1 family)